MCKERVCRSVYSDKVMKRYRYYVQGEGARQECKKSDQ